VGLKFGDEKEKNKILAKSFEWAVQYGTCLWWQAGEILSPRWAASPGSVCWHSPPACRAPLLLPPPPSAQVCTWIFILLLTTDGRLLQEVFADTLHQPVVLHSYSRHHHPLRSEHEYSNLGITTGFVVRIRIHSSCWIGIFFKLFLIDIEKNVLITFLKKSIFSTIKKH
jgi:hypothetical protein